MLWAMEEALRCRALAGVVAEAEAIGLAAGRRLMLAAEGTGVLGLVLSRGHGRGRRGGAGGSVAVSRWLVTCVPGTCRRGGEAEARWRVEVLHCRGGRPAGWLVGWGGGGWSARPPDARTAVGVGSRHRHSVGRARAGTVGGETPGRQGASKSGPSAR